MKFYAASHGKLHDRGYSDILYGINSIDIIGCYHMVIIMFYYLYWVDYGSLKVNIIFYSFMMNCCSMENHQINWQVQDSR